MKTKMTMDQATPRALDSDWATNVWENFCTYTLGPLGLDHMEHEFTGFWSQGDGACFYGGCGNARAILEAALTEKDFAVMDAEFSLVSPNEDLFEYIDVILSKNSGSRYSHEYTVCIVVDISDHYLDDAEDEVILRHLTVSVQIVVGEFLRKLMRDLYDQLREEHDYLTSDEVVRELAEANDWEICDDNA